MAAGQENKGLIRLHQFHKGIDMALFFVTLIFGSGGYNPLAWGSQSLDSDFKSIEKERKKLVQKTNNPAGQGIKQEA